MFEPVTSKPNFPEIEERILQFWKANNTFQKSILARSTGPHFTLYEGPPTANGRPGIHHALSRSFKDVISRYKVMQGYYAPRKAGWDTHGLPVELEVEKTLGFTSKVQIEEYGVAKFNALCRKSVLNYLKDWEAMTERIGFWLDLEQPYMTMENSYIESCWWALKQLWDKNLVYQGYKVTPHCPRCGTSLSSHEVALGYKDDTEDPSIYVKFKINPSSLKKGTILHSTLNHTSSIKPAFLLAWTTTPWTLPGNTALAVSPQANYLILESEQDYLILAETLVNQLKPEDYKPVALILGKELSVEYEPLFNPHQFSVERRRFGSVSKRGSYEIFIRQPSKANLTYPVITAEFVSLNEGTGIVHIAPAFGEVDFEAGKMEGLDFVQPVDSEGKISGNYPFAGKFVKEADPLILDNLRNRGLIYRSERIIHTYPFCWRCETPLLYYAKKTWYIRTTARKKELVSGNSEINWYPEHIKYGRFGDWLENNVDWAFSRERYWGTPLNIWHCLKCNNYECVGSIEELKTKPHLEGWQENLDMHRPYVDDIKFNCSECGGEMKRQTEVIDCWFDSGAMPFAQWHYPFKNKDKFEENFPADFISEAVDQTRGWFYSLHSLSTLIFNQPCFKNVICLGHILDSQGEKMSKTRGNVVEPWQVIDRYGTDALRWYFFISAPAGNVRRFSEETIADIVRSFLLTLWNIYSFFTIYANIDNFVPKLEKAIIPSDLDRWILSELNFLIQQVTDALDNYNPTTAARNIDDFVDSLSNWYVRRSRRRFWKSENDADKMAAYTTLYQCLVSLCKLLAPFVPFIAEELYRNLVCSASPEAPESVHLTDFPIADIAKIDDSLMADTKLIIKISSWGRSARNKAEIKVRQPLAKLIVKVESEKQLKVLETLAYQIKDEVNVKEVEFTVKEPVFNKQGFVTITDEEHWVALDTELSSELIAEGIARELVRRLQTMRRAAGFDIADHIITYYSGGVKIKKVMEKFATYIKQETLSRELIEGSPEPGVSTQTFDIDGIKIALGVKRL